MKHFLLTTIFLSSTLLVGCHHCGVGEAKTSALQFADQRFPGHKGVECLGGSTPDSDGDGYASCTIFLADDAVPIECATENGPWSSTGCRVATGH